MRSKRRSGITALTAAIALGIGAIPVTLTAPTLLAGGEETVTLVPAAAAAGTLSLTTTSGAGSVRWSESNLTQGFTGGLHCEIEIDVTPTSADLLQITGSVGESPDGKAGFKNGSIGVFEFEDENSSQCFRVDPGSFTPKELLNLKLGDDLVDFLGPLKANAASFTLLKQQSGNLTVTATFYSGATLVRTETVGSPKSAKAGTVFALTVPPGTVFDRVTLEAAGGAFSLIGRTTFDLVSEAEYRMSCKQGENSITEQGGTTTETTITYTGNADGSNCTNGFGVRLDTDDPSGFTFLKPTTVAPTAEFIVHRDWSIPLPGTGFAQVPATLVDFANTPATEDDVPIDWCPDAVFAEGTHDLTGVSATPTEDLYNGQVGVQYACVGTQSAEARGGQLIVSEQIYLYGDVIMRKGY